MNILRKAMREPLAHFLLIGAGLFLMFSFMNGSVDEKPNRIVVSPGQVEQLAANFSRTWMRPPTEDEIAGLVREHVRDEVYYREALAMGLDQNDTLIRRRMRQKMEFLNADLAEQRKPTEAELRTWFEAHPERYALPPRRAFE